MANGSYVWVYKFPIVIQTLRRLSLTPASFVRHADEKKETKARIKMSYSRLWSIGMEFRSDYIRSHHLDQHTERWAEY